MYFQEGINASSFYGDTQVIKYGSLDTGFANSTHIIEGEAEIGGQLHFYMETHASLAVPKDGEELEVYCSTQSPTSVQV